MSNEEKVYKAIKLFGFGPTSWIAQQVDLPEETVSMIHWAWIKGMNVFNDRG